MNVTLLLSDSAWLRTSKACYQWGRPLPTFDSVLGIRSTFHHHRRRGPIASAPVEIGSTSLSWCFLYRQISSGKQQFRGGSQRGAGGGGAPAEIAVGDCVNRWQLIPSAVVQNRVARAARLSSRRDLIKGHQYECWRIVFHALKEFKSFIFTRVFT